MLTLAGGTHFLVLRGDGEHHVASFRRFDDALQKWDSRSRISPLIAIENAPPPDFAEHASSALLFFGPAFPGDLEWLYRRSQSVFLSLGLLNVVVFCSERRQADEIVNELSEKKVHWERWDLAGDVVIETSEAPRTRCSVPATVSDPLLVPPKSLLPTARECQTLLTTTYSRSDIFGQSASLERYADGLRRLLKGSSRTDLDRLQFLLNTNVALSRHLWQTYSGSARISENPCHLSTHSLLGIGTASLALRNLARFVEDIYHRLNLSERLHVLKARPPVSGKSLPRRAGTDPLWASYPLDDIQEGELARFSYRDPIPTLTYYSSRDGFRATPVTLSAPLEVITSCNTASWTLQTLTHELSHTVVRALLGHLIPDPSDSAGLERLIRVVEETESPSSLFEQLQAQVCFGMWALRHGEQASLTVPHMQRVLREDVDETDELLTHVFDFIHHYNGQPERYLRAVWASWATIPQIDDRVPQYVVRTLCAFHSAHLGRPLEISLEAFRHHLELVAKAFPESPYLPAAIDLLRNEAAQIRTDTGACLPLVKLGRLLASRRAVASLWADAEQVEKLRSCHFDTETISNPLAFVERWSEDERADSIRAVWILQYLAYGLGGSS